MKIDKKILSQGKIFWRVDEFGCLQVIHGNPWQYMKFSQYNYKGELVINTTTVSSYHDDWRIANKEDIDSLKFMTELVGD